MRRMGTLLTVAVWVAGGNVYADDSNWRPNGQAVPQPANKPADSPWSPSSGDTPKWVAASAPIVSAVPQQATPPIAPTIPLPSGSEPLPQPRSVIPQQDVPLKPATKPLSVEKQTGLLPKPQPVLPQTPPPTPTPVPFVPSNGNVIWGASPMGTPCPQVVAASGLPAVGAVVPSRRGAFGSPNLTLSRDRHFLDIFGLGRFGEDSETVVLGESPITTDRYFVQADYLLWWMRAGNVPVLASTGAAQSFGYLGQPGTQTLLGPGTFGTTARNGFRIRGGMWCDDCLSQGVDGSVFFLGRQSSRFQIDSNQFPTIARPIFAPNFNQEFAELVAFPGLSSGTLLAETSSALWGADLNYRQSLCRTCTSHSEIFAGYRHLNLREDLAITEFIIAGPNAPDPQGTNIVVQDSFKTRNRFHGGQVGYAFGQRMGRFDVDGRVSVALGVNAQEVEINGTQSRTRPGQVAERFTGGLLAAGPNIGTFNRDKFSVAPEATLNVGYRVTPNLRTYVGYNFLYWSNVIRPGDQIDRTVDLTFIPNGPPVPFSQNRPLPTFKQSDLWVHGVQFGLELRW